jgi:hypothetical protein
MKKRSIKRLLVILLVSAASVIWATTGIADLSRTIERSFSVAPGGTLDLETDKGSIEVRTSPEPRVDILVDLDADTSSKRKAREILDKFSVDMVQFEKGIRIEARFDSDRAGFWDRDRKRLQVRFEIVVPQQYDLNLRTSGGSIQVADITGEVKSVTSGGGLKFGNIAGSLDARTSGGSIRLANCSGPAKVETSGGSISIATAAGPVNAKTSGGSIRVDEVMGAIDAQTSGGSIEAYISRQPEAACTLKTSGGSINIYLPSGVGLEVDAKTSGGRVSTDFPVTVVGDLKRSALKGTISAGGPRMYLRTSGGNIRLLKH